MVKNILPLLLVITLGIGMMAGCSAAAPASVVAISSEPASVVAISSETASVAAVSSEPAASVAVSTSGNQSENGYGAAGALADNDLTTEEMLVYAMQDEHLAHGEYVHILTIFGNQNPFTNIIKAEEKHIADLGVLFAKYNVPVPEDASASHIIVPESVKTALETGVQAEISNIAMYAHFLEQPLPDDVKDVFVLLMKGSESHLAAFQKNLGK